MTDLAAVTIVGILSAGVTSAWGTWLHFQVNRNACGGARCVDTMRKALKINTGVPYASSEAAHGYDHK